MFCVLEQLIEENNYKSPFKKERYMFYHTSNGYTQEELLLTQLKSAMQIFL